MFGGQLKWLGGRSAETTILRFGEGVDTGHCIAISMEHNLRQNHITTLQIPIQNGIEIPSN